MQRTRQRISVVFLKQTPVNTSQLSIDQVRYDYVVTLIHEIIHNAPNDLSWAGMHYQHPDMSRAVWELDRSINIDVYIKKHCIPEKYW